MDKMQINILTNMTLNEMMYMTEPWSWNYRIMV